MADLTEKTQVRLSMKVFLSVAFSLVIAVVFVLGVYSGLTGTDKDIKKELELKADKKDFEKHCYSDSLRFEYFTKDMKKDLQQIKQKLNIKENN